MARPYKGAIKLQRDRAFSEITSNATLKAVALANLGVGSATTQTLKASTVQDSNALARFIPNAAAKTIVDGSATSLFSVALAAGASIGGAMHFHVFASNGTDHQGISGLVTYSAVDKATVVTGTITYVAANEAKAVSSGTLTLAFTADATVADVVTYKLQPTGSLTETTFQITYSLYPIKGVVTIL